MTARNTVLAEALAELGWSITKLVKEINTVLGKTYVGRSAISEWINHSRVPHDPLPTVVAHLLTHATGKSITVEQLWPGEVRPSQLWLPADTGFNLPWNADGTIAVMNDWLNNSGGFMDHDRRNFLAVSGTALTAPIWKCVDSFDDGPTPWAKTNKHALHQDSMTPMMVNTLEHSIQGMRRLDDQAGGGHTQHLRFVHSHLSLVTTYLKDGNIYDGPVAQRLVKCWAQLAQIAGFMAQDAAQEGLAQRYNFTALRAAQSAGDRNLVAYVLGFMIRLAVHQGQVRDAVELANTAMEASEGTHPLIRAITASRYAFAQAAAGDQYGFRTAVDQAHEWLSKASEINNEAPEYAYWCDKSKLIGQTGVGLTLLGLSSTRDTTSLLDEAQQALAKEMDWETTDTPRDTVYYGAWQARALSGMGDLEGALASARTALSRHPRVRSPLSLRLLCQLNEEIVSRRGMKQIEAVKEFQEQLNTALAG